ncbi:MAG: EFR1 family ferrodoxin [Eggerthellales bacterium]|nr:EFR1 family ferrodoxin [Eggerthellales bacterium]
MILYFTGSGNSKFVADLIAHVVGDQTLSLNEAIKSGKPLSVTSDKPYVIVTPIYAFDLPHVVMRAVSEATLSGSGEAYVVVTCGDRSANAHRSARRLIEGKGMTYLGFYDVVMPDNTVTMFDMPDAATAQAKIREALPGLVEAAGKIAKGEPVSGACKGPGFLTSINGMMIKRMENAKGWGTTEACTSCGTCVKVCPVNNLSLDDAGKVIFAGSCVSCYSCIHHCPTNAMHIQGKTEKRGQYRAPQFDPSWIG